MKIVPEKFKVDERRSNPMIVAMQYLDCPINDICVYMAIGFGSVVEKCKFFEDQDHGISAWCTQDVKPF
jgi:hypothetical protein